MSDTILIRVKSRRARHRVEQVLKRKPDGYFSFDFEGEFREVTGAEYERLQTCGVKGVCRARVDATKLRRHWV